MKKIISAIAVVLIIILVFLFIVDIFGWVILLVGGILVFAAFSILFSLPFLKLHRHEGYCRKCGVSVTEITTDEDKDLNNLICISCEEKEEKKEREEECFQYLP